MSTSVRSGFAEGVGVGVVGGPGAGMGVGNHSRARAGDVGAMATPMAGWSDMPGGRVA
jgi:hypothetical protein